MQTVRRVTPQTPSSPIEKLLHSVMPTSRPPLTRSRRYAALAIALAADALQIAFFPLFGLGAIEGFDAIGDVAVAFVLTRLLGWHMSFLPGFLLELMPLVDLAPTWTLAVLIATRGRADEPKRGDLIDPSRV